MPFVIEEPLDVLDHRPLEQELAGVLIALEPLLDPLASRSRADPEVPLARRAQGVAEPALDVVHRPPAAQVAGVEAADFLLALSVVLAELEARPVVERHEHPRAGGDPPESSTGQAQLLDHQRVQEPDEVRARRDPIPRPDLFERASPADPLAGLQDEHPLARPGQIRRAGQPIMPRPHDDHVPGPGRHLPDRHRQAQHAQGVGRRSGSVRGHFRFTFKNVILATFHDGGDKLRPRTTIDHDRRLLDTRHASR